MFFFSGFDTGITLETLNTGAKFNKKCKIGADDVSEKARSALSIQEFHKLLVKNIEQIHGFR